MHRRQRRGRPWARPLARALVEPKQARQPVAERKFRPLRLTLQLLLLMLRLQPLTPLRLLLPTLPPLRLLLPMPRLLTLRSPPKLPRLPTLRNPLKPLRLLTQSSLIAC